MSLPYYKRFPRDFLDGTIGLDLETKGAYGIVLDLIYMRDGRLEADPQYIAGQLGCSVRKWNAILSVLVEKHKLIVTDGIISNFRADYLTEESRKYQDKQAEIAGKPRKNKGLQQPKPSQSESEPKTEDKSSVSASAKEKPQRRKPETRLPEGFPDMEALKTAKAMVLAEAAQVKLTLEAEKFRNHAVQTDRRLRDWPAGWRNWVLNAIERAPKGITVSPAAPRSVNWAARVKEWTEDNYWNTVDWGPKPGQPGCQCPPEFLT